MSTNRCPNCGSAFVTAQQIDVVTARVFCHDCNWTQLTTVNNGVAEVRVTDPETGGQKGKKPEEYALIPVGPLAEVARVYGYGAAKYGEPNNWRRGYKWSLSFSALCRHIFAFWRGEERDPESGFHHLAHATFHLFSLMTFSGDGEKYGALDDRAL